MKFLNGDYGSVLVVENEQIFIRMDHKPVIGWRDPVHWKTWEVTRKINAKQNADSSNRAVLNAWASQNDYGGLEEVEKASLDLQLY